MGTLTVTTAGLSNFAIRIYHDPMGTMNIALPESLKRFVRRRVEDGGYGSTSEYLRELIRMDQKQSARAKLEAELVRGLASGPATEMTKEDWATIRQSVQSRAKTRK